MEIIRNKNSANIKCIKCGDDIIISISENKKMQGLTVECKCGCIQRCISEDKEYSGWRVMNPFI